jgi:hypothetical protein
MPYLRVRPSGARRTEAPNLNRCGGNHGKKGSEKDGRIANSRIIGHWDIAGSHGTYPANSDSSFSGVHQRGAIVFLSNHALDVLTGSLWSSTQREFWLVFL